MSTDTLNILVSASAGSRYSSGTQTSRGLNLKACPKCQGAVEIKIDSGCPVIWCITCGLTRWL